MFDGALKFMKATYMPATCACFFFFQAEDGIRDLTVTGVQTCALPIYDALVRELAGLEEQFPELVTPDSPTQRVGAPPSDLFAAVAHPSPMWSLDNAFSFDALVAWGKRVERVLGAAADYWCELKVDGAAVDLTYVDGRLPAAATPGHWRTGEDITANA